MNQVGKVCGMLLLAMSVVGAQAQSPVQKSTAKPSHAKPRTQEQLLLEQLKERFQELEQMNEKFKGQQQEIDDLKLQLKEAKQAAATAQATATDTRQELEKAQLNVGENDDAVAKLQSSVGDLKIASSPFAETLQADQKATRALEAPDVLHFKSISLTPGGFVAGETVWRQRGIGVFNNQGVPLTPPSTWSTASSYYTLRGCETTVKIGTNSFSLISMDIGMVFDPSGNLWAPNGSGGGHLGFNASNLFGTERGAFYLCH